ncbi:MAG: dynamin family protein [Methylococcus sp.]|nr:dynamin family protein [Methylococcus sp.]
MTTLLQLPPEAASYDKFRTELLGMIDDLAAHFPARLRPALVLRDKLRAEHFDVLTVGQFKRGKTSLINALLGDNLLPTAAVPLTSVVTVLSYGETLRITVFFLDGGTLDIARDRLADYVAESANPGNRKGVKEVLILLPSPLLKSGVRIVDTPGVGSVFRHNTDTAYARLPQCDAALFVLSADQPVGEAELEFLREVGKYAGRIFFLLNKIDIFDAAEIAEIEVFSRATLEQALGTEARLFPVSAKQASAAKSSDDPTLLAGSRLPALDAALDRFLMREKGRLLLLAAADRFTRLVAQSRLEAELERSALNASMAELDENMALFADRRAAAVRDRQRLDSRLRSEFRLLAKNLVGGDLPLRKQEQASRLNRKFDGLVLSHDDLPPKEFDALLEAFVRDEPVEAFAGWRETLERHSAEAFAAIGEEFERSITEHAAELQRFAGDLFQVAVDAPPLATHWPARSQTALRPASEPVGLELLAEHAMRSGPDYIGKRFGGLKALATRWAKRNIVQRRRRQLLEAVEMQSGRIRSESLRRLELGREALSAELAQRLDTVADGIEQAMERGRREHSKASADTGPRCERLEEQIAVLDRLEAQAAKFRERAAGTEC